MNVEEVYACINMLRALEDQKSFFRYIKEKKIRQSKSKLFKGYRLMIRAIQRAVLHNLAEEPNYLDLENNFTFYRARFNGTPLQKISDSCDAIVFIKNLHYLFQSCWKAESWQDMKTKLGICDKIVFTIFDNLYARLKPKKTGFSKEEILQSITLDFILVFLSDTSRNRPNCYYVSFLEKGLRIENDSETIEGYKLALVFLWEHCGGFADAATKIIRLKNDWQSLDGSFRIMRSYTDKTKPWLDLDSWFEITKPLSKKELDHLLSQKRYAPVMQSKKEELEEAFYWYEIDALTSEFFSTFGTLLVSIRGAVSYAKEMGDKITLIRLLHSRPHENGNDYSYAILLSGGGILSDPSGWLLFPEIATDYSGQGGYQHKRIEEEINKAVDNIEIKTINVSYDILEKELNISGLNKIDLVRNNKRLRDNNSKLKGNLTEQLVRSIFIARGFEIKGASLRIKGKEIDLLAEKNNELYCIEIQNKFNLNEEGIDSLIREFKDKERLLRLDYPDHSNIKKIFVVTTVVTDKYNQKLIDSGIELELIDRRTLEELKLSSSRIKELFDILEINEFNSRFRQKFEML